MQNNQYYKNAALEALKGLWAPAVVVTIVFMAIVMAIVSPGCITEFFPLPVGWIMGIAGANMLLSYFVSIPLSVGYYNAFRLLYTQGDDRLTSNMFKLGFTNCLCLCHDSVHTCGASGDARHRCHPQVERHDEGA